MSIYLWFDCVGSLLFCCFCIAFLDQRWLLIFVAVVDVILLFDLLCVWLRVFILLACVCLMMCLVFGHCECVLLICFEFVGANRFCSVILLLFMSVCRVDVVCVLAFVLRVLV